MYTFKNPNRISNSFFSIVYSLFKGSDEEHGMWGHMTGYEFPFHPLLTVIMG